MRHSLFQVEKDEFQPPALKSKSMWYEQLKDETSTGITGSNEGTHQKIVHFSVVKTHFFRSTLQCTFRFFTPPVL
jgi:hypothetical protein